MASGGYVPSRDEMSVIVAAARDLYRVTRRWQEYSSLPGYPIERGNAAALEALFRLERALNPRCLGWDRPTRKVPPIECWPPQVAEGYFWVRNLLDRILERNRLQALAMAAELRAWLAEGGSAPEVIAIQKEELKALRILLHLLPKSEKLPEARPKPPAEPAATADQSAPSPPIRLADSLSRVMQRIPVPVVLLSPGDPPLVLGEPKPLLTGQQFRVVKALLDAGEGGLSKAALNKLCGDALGVLKRLHDSDEDWKAVIRLAGTKGKKYRIVAHVPKQGAGPPEASQGADAALAAW